MSLLCWPQNTTVISYFILLDGKFGLHLEVKFPTSILSPSVRLNSVKFNHDTTSLIDERRGRLCLNSDKITFITSLDQAQAIFQYLDRHLN